VQTHTHMCVCVCTVAGFTAQDTGISRERQSHSHTHSRASTYIHTHTRTCVYSGGTIGAGSWDNSQKALLVNVRAILKPHTAYTFWFQVVNPPHGQPRPVILIGSSFDSIGLSTCPPWARPLSTRVQLHIYNSTDLKNRDSNRSYYSIAESVVRYTITSLEDASVIHGCSVPGSDTQGVLLPAGQWFVTVSAEGMFSEILELRTSILQHPQGINQMVVAQVVSRQHAHTHTTSHQHAHTHTTLHQHAHTHTTLSHTRRLCLWVSFSLSLSLDLSLALARARSLSLALSLSCSRARSLSLCVSLTRR